VCETQAVRIGRIAICFAILVAAPSAAVASDATRGPAAAKKCLVAAGARFEQGHEFFRYPEETSVLYWVVGYDRSNRTIDITIYWTPNAVSAKRLVGRFLRLGLAGGVLASEVKPLLGRLDNVVWVAGIVEHPATPSQVALLKRCLS
jgi:hypothetical protein